jgi:Tol biopolymer transport system component
VFAWRWRCFSLGLAIGFGGGERAVDVVDRIAFVGTDDNLYLIDRQGENLEYLAVGGEGIALTFPTWSPDGRRVAFMARRGGSEGVGSILYTVSTVGGDPTTLYASHESLAFYLYWSPDSRYLLYSDQESPQHAGIWVVDVQGRESPRRLADGTLAVWSWR